MTFRIGVLANGPSPKAAIAAQKAIFANILAKHSAEKLVCIPTKFSSPDTARSLALKCGTGNMEHFEIPEHAIDGSD